MQQNQKQIKQSQTRFGEMVAEESLGKKERLRDIRKSG